MSKSKVSKSAAKVISDIIYETLKQCKTADERRTLVNLNDQIIKARYADESISYESCEIMIDCFKREKVECDKSTEKIKLQVAERV